MPAGNPFVSELIGVKSSSSTVLGSTAPTKTNVSGALFAIPGYRLQIGSVLQWEAFGQIQLNSANITFTPSVELGSLQTYNTTHSRSGTNHGLVLTTADPVSGRQFLPNGASSAVSDWWGRGSCVVTAAPGASVTARGGGHMHFPGVDQGGGSAASMGFDTDGSNSSTINTTSSLNFGLYVQWQAGATASDIFTCNMFAVSILGYTSPL